ncbi:MAG: MipA/OmpV family protein [Rubrivivax sp.]|nr:MipA/OmpV family protein [Rubrivivax sp.]
MAVLVGLPGAAPAAETAPAPAPVAEPGKEAGEDDEPSRAPGRAWDAAIGFIASYAPEYAGASRRTLGIKPGGWVRFGRVSIATRSSFVVRTGEAVTGGGVRVDLSRGGKLRMGLGLRQDSGRQESDSPDLRGLGDVRRTVRLRLAASYPLEAGWRLGAALTADLLGRGGGELADFRLSRGFVLAPRVSGSVDATLTFGSRRYMQAWYGIDEAQAARSGYPTYFPSAGLRDVTLGAGLRHETPVDWVLFAGVSATRLVGPAAASPLTRERNSWALSAGIGYRF